MDLVDGDAGEVVDPRRAVPEGGVDLLGGGDDDVVVAEVVGRVVVARRDCHVDPGERVELLVFLTRERAKRDDVQPRPVGGQHRHLREERLARRRRDGREDVRALGDAGLDGRRLRRVQVLDTATDEVVPNLRGQRQVADVHR